MVRYLLTLTKVSLEGHVLSDITTYTSPDLVRMNAVVRTWILNTISDDLADAVSQRGVTDRVLWLSIESQFLGNRTTRALYADQEFRSSQGDLPVAEYCRRYKKLAEDLRDLGEPVSDRTLVLNIIRGLNEHFLALGLHLRRTYPLPSFLQVRDDLALEELTMAKAPPAAALAALTAPGSMGSTTSPAPSTGTPRHSQQPATQLPAPSQPSGGGSGGRYNSNQRGKRGKRNCGRHSTTTRADAGPPTGQVSQYSYYNPWSGAIYMWLGQRPPTTPRPPHGVPSSPQALLAGPPSQWTVLCLCSHPQIRHFVHPHHFLCLCSHSVRNHHSGYSVGQRP
jgi:hypothetical protein